MKKAVRNWIGGGLALLAMVGGAAQAAQIGPLTTIPAGGYTAIGNTGYGTQAGISFSFLNSGQAADVSSLLAENPDNQSATLGLYFADDGDGLNWWGSETSDFEYFQYSLDNGQSWIGTISSQFEVDGSICYFGSQNLNDPYCRSQYWEYEIDVLDALLAGVTSIGLRVNPDYTASLGFINIWDIFGFGGHRTTPQDFYFKGTSLVVSGTASTTSVPEPATLALTLLGGLGLLGMGYRQRRGQPLAA